MDPHESSSSSKKKKSSKSSFVSKSSKKRARESETSDLDSTSIKRPSLASGELQSGESGVLLAESDGRLDWASKLQHVLCEKVLQSGVIQVLKCDAPECGFPSFGSNLAPESPSIVLPPPQLSPHDTLRCNSLVLAHPFAWHEEITRPKKDGVVVRIHRLFSMVECARWLALQWHPTCDTFHWTYLMITKIQEQIESFKAVMKEKPIKRSAALDSLLASLSETSSSSLSKTAASLKISSNQTTDHTLSNSSIELQETHISSLLALDTLYYLIYHYALVSPIASPSHARETEQASEKPKKTSTKQLLSIPAPAEYFLSYLQPVKEEVQVMVSLFWKQEIDRVTRERAQKAIGTFEMAQQSSTTNPLLFIWYLRFYEYVRLFYASGLTKNSKEMEHAVSLAGTSGIVGKRLSNLKRVKQKQLSKENESEPISGELLQAWRDISRDWPSLLYAYAVPTDLALDTIQAYAPIVEVGAGTGYWAHLLKKRGISIMAYDTVPTTTDGEQNEYHANVPPFFPVNRSGVQVVRKTATSSLFLCFPPPEDTMALDAVKLYSGQYVIHVGEWEGFTGSSEFEKHIFSNFLLVKRVELPNWQDTSYDLTVWQRKIPTPGAPTPQTSTLTELHANLTTLQCFSCGKLSSVLRRCRCCRLASFCSKSCASSASRQHSSVHALNGLFLPDINDSLDYNHRKHYRLLRTKDL